MFNEVAADVITDLRICDVTGRIDDALLCTLRRCDYLIANSTDAKEALEHFGANAIVIPSANAADPSPVDDSRTLNASFSSADHAASINDPPLARAA